MRRKKRLTFCHLCGFPQSCGRLIRISWEDETWEDESGITCKMIVPRAANHNDSLLCMDCIRQIKRLPFSALEQSPAVPRRFPIGGDGPFETDVPF